MLHKTWFYEKKMLVWLFSNLQPPSTFKDANIFLNSSMILEGLEHDIAYSSSGMVHTEFL